MQPPRSLVRDYKAAARRYRIPWVVLAAINYIETGYGSDLHVSSAGAVGWMQFMPSTWAEYGEAVSRRGHIESRRLGSPYSPNDAIFAAARLLVANGARKNLAKAIFAYNHADWYVQEVLTVAQRIASHGIKRHSRPRRRLAAMREMAQLLSGIEYQWGGGHVGADWIVSTGYDCSGFVSEVLHAGGFLKTPVTTETLPSQRGVRSGRGKLVTIFDRTNAGLSEDHVIIDLHGQWWESGGSSTAGGAGYVHRIRRVDRAYLRSFNLVLHPQGM